MMAFAIKAEIVDPRADSFAFPAQKTMYGGRNIAVGDPIFIFASENEGGSRLIARGLVAFSELVREISGIVRTTPRISVEIRRLELVKRPLGRRELKPFVSWNDGQPQTELNFKLYRQATNKIVGVSDETAIYLGTFF